MKNELLKAITDSETTNSEEYVMVLGGKILLKKNKYIKLYYFSYSNQ